MASTAASLAKLFPLQWLQISCASLLSTSFSKHHTCCQVHNFHIISRAHVIDLFCHISMKISISTQRYETMFVQNIHKYSRSKLLICWGENSDHQKDWKSWLIASSIIIFLFLWISHYKKGETHWAKRLFQYMKLMNKN